MAYVWSSIIGIGIANTFFMKYMYWYWLYFLKVLLTTLQGISRGIAIISKWYATANNPYVEGFDLNLPTTYITYLDVNNLYGKAQSEPLPVSGFRVLDESELKDFDVMSIRWPTLWAWLYCRMWSNLSTAYTRRPFGLSACIRALDDNRQHAQWVCKVWSIRNIHGTLQKN